MVKILISLSILLVVSSNVKALSTDATLHDPIVAGQQTPQRETHFIGGGIKKIGSQLVFPFRHPIKYANNCTYPCRHPLEAFGRFSVWVEPYNSGLNAASSVASIGSSIGIYGLYGKLHNAN